MSLPRCPRCGAEVGGTWRWCLACGYDPDGTQIQIREAAVEAHLKKGSWLPVVVVLVGMVIGAAILWRTAPGDDTGTGAAPIVLQSASWQQFSAPDGSFRVEFPAAPASAGDAVAGAGASNETSYIAYMNQQLFGVVVVDTGRSQLDEGVPDEVAHSVLTDYIRSSGITNGGRLASSTPARVSAAPALDYVIEDTPLGHSEGRAVLVGRQIYNVIVSGAQLTEADVTRFVRSFALG